MTATAMEREPRDVSRQPQSGALRPTDGRPVGRYPVPSLEELPEDMQARIVSVNDKLGFVPNVFWTLAHRPDEFRAFFAFFDALMLKESGVTKAEREMIVVATSALNDSVYCVAHHGAILRLRARNATIADQIATNYRRANLSPRERAMLDFAAKVATDSHAIDEADMERLAEHGFSDEDTWDIGAITAFFSYGSRMANLIDMRPNDEFYMLGRARA
jgi:uncharacterized peroxidase-related enzyme